MNGTVGCCGGGVARDAVLAEGISPVGWAFGLFCARGGVSKGSLSPWAGAVGVLQVKLSFQRDTTLCNRYNTCKTWYRCENGTHCVGIAVKSPLARDTLTQVLAGNAVPVREQAPRRFRARVFNCCEGRLRAASGSRRTVLGRETTYWGRLVPIGAGE